MMNSDSIDETNAAEPLCYPGPQPTWVLLHGAGCDKHFWGNTIEALRHEEGAIFAASMPGRDGQPSPLKNVEQMAMWVETTLAAHNIHSPILVGHSLGGGIAQELAFRSAAGVGIPLAGLVLLATGARLRVHPNIFRLMREQSETGQHGASLLPWQPTTNPAIIEAYCKLPTPPIATTFADWKAVNGFDRMADLASFTTPTLVIGGEADPLTPPKYAKYLADHIPDARLHMLPDSGHMFPVEEGEALTKLLATWRAERFG